MFLPERVTGLAAGRGRDRARDIATVTKTRRKAMVELIERGEPAVMLCHWPGMYCNGSKAGFIDFQKVVLSLAKDFKTKRIG